MVAWRGCVVLDRLLIRSVAARASTSLGARGGTTSLGNSRLVDDGGVG